MLQEISPYQFSNEYMVNSKLPPDNHSVAIIWKDGCFLCKMQGTDFQLPQANSLPTAQLSFLISIEKTRFYLYLAKDIENLSHFLNIGFVWKKPRELRYLRPAWMRYGTLISAQLATWYEQNKYCGCCGNRLSLGTNERSLVCASCNSIVYPRINPCVIVAVTNGDKILLTKYAGEGKFKKYALVAGFCEIGETAEETAAREVKEETGLSITNVRFYKSQPWPFSSSLLFGFFCDVDGEPQPHPDGSELDVAEWVSRERVPIYENEISLTYEMMDAFRKNLIL